MDKSSITKLIKTTLRKNTEKKIFTDYATNFAIVTAVSSTPTFRSLLPLISQGSGKSQRVGNDIRVTKAELNVIVNLLPYSATTNQLNTPVWVKMWVLRYKLEANQLHYQAHDESLRTIPDDNPYLRRSVPNLGF